MEIIIRKFAYNPNIVTDIQKILKTTKSVEEIISVLDGLEPKQYNQLSVFLDRIEFINHLKLIECYFEENQYMLNGNEFNGIDNDLKSLKIYLSLTCIDILSNRYQSFEEWILKNCNDYNPNSSLELKQYIKNKADEYHASNGISQQFFQKFTNLDEAHKTEIINNVCLVDGKRNNDDMTAIAKFLFKVRNNYTHNGIRVCFPNNINTSYEISMNEFINHKKEIIKLSKNNERLRVKAGFDLPSAIIDIAILNCKKKYNLN